jgi:ABC-type branched-subunit amino acid transport system ATPase component
LVRSLRSIKSAGRQHDHLCCHLFLPCLLVEHKLSIALRIADKMYVMGHGEIVYEGTPQDFLARSDIRKEWLEV